MKRRKLYTYEENTSGAAKQGTPQHIWNRLCSDMSFNSITVSVAARQAKHNGNNTYAYRYDGFKNKNAFHGWEVALTFGNGQVNPRGQDFSQKIINPLINFIHTGNPNNGGGIDVEWLPWSKENISAIILSLFFCLMHLKSFLIFLTVGYRY